MLRPRTLGARDGHATTSWKSPLPSIELCKLLDSRSITIPVTSQTIAVSPIDTPSLPPPFSSACLICASVATPISLQGELQSVCLSNNDSTTFLPHIGQSTRVTEFLHPSIIQSVLEFQAYGSDRVSTLSSLPKHTRAF